MAWVFVETVWYGAVGVAQVGGGGGLSWEYYCIAKEQKERGNGLVESIILISRYYELYYCTVCDILCRAL